MGPLPAPARRSRHGATAAALAVAALGAVASPASAVGPRPTADALKTTAQAATPAVGTIVDRTEAAVPAVEPVTARVRTSVAELRAQAPVRSVLEAVRAPVESATAGAEPVVRAVAERAGTAAASAAPAAERPALDDAGPRAAGGIDRRASRRAGELAPDGRGGSIATVASSAFDPARVVLAPATAEPADSAASSTAASGDDGAPDGGFPPFGHDGGSALGGPAGIALIALGMLAALSTLIPRFSSRLLPMSPARWGPAAFLVPIERPD